VKLVIHQDFLRVGGTESQSIFLAKRFQEKGHEVTLLTHRTGGSLSDRAQQYGLHHQSLQARDRGCNWYAPGLRRQYQSLQPEIALLMGRNANCQGFRLRRWFPDLKIVNTLRTGRRLTWMYRKSLRKANLLLCNSEFLSHQALVEQLTPAPVEVHPNACMRHEEILSNPALASRSQRHKSDSRSNDSRHPWTLLYTAAFVGGKRHRDLIEMVSRLHVQIPVRLLLVGEGPLESACKQMVQNKGIQDFVEFRGFCEEMAPVFAEADLAVSTSVEESMPNALVEAQYAGLPVVAYDVAGVKETFIPQKSGVLIDPQKPENMEQALLDLYKNPEKCDSMSRESILFARNQFDPDIRFDALERSLLNALKSSH